MRAVDRSGWNPTACTISRGCQPVSSSTSPCPSLRRILTRINETRTQLPSPAITDEPMTPSAPARPRRAPPEPPPKAAAVRDAQTAPHRAARRRPPRPPPIGCRKSDARMHTPARLLIFEQASGLADGAAPLLVTSEPGFYRCPTPVAAFERKLERVGVRGKPRVNENKYPQRRRAGPSLASPPRRVRGAVRATRGDRIAISPAPSRA